MKIMSVILMVLLPSVAFSETVTIACGYKSYANSDGIHKLNKTFELIFIIDSSNGKAYIVGNNGTEEVHVIKKSVGEGIAFIEITDTGNVMTTAVDAKNNSVHSRNTMIANELIPSQYYGDCIYK